MIVLYVSVFIFLCYAVLVISLSFGWFSLRDYKRNNVPVHTKVSVICAMRNEENNINNLLQSLTRQDMPGNLFEIIIVNDHSNDATQVKIEHFIRNYKGDKNIRLLNLSDENGCGKKAGIHEGISIATGDLIFITDADCVADPRWISVTTAYYEETKPHLILGALYMSNSGSFFGKLQTLDFMSLIAATAAACYLEKPLMANGANIAYTKEAYWSCGGFLDNIKYASGDDMFLMMDVKKKYGGRAIKFLRSRETMVSTPAEENIKLFWNQRKRWISKNKGYKDNFVIGSSLVMFFAYLLLVFLGILSFFDVFYFNILVGVFFAKMLIDIPVIQSYARYMKNSSLIWFFPLWELITPLYTVVIGIAGTFSKYQWKGRTHAAKD